MQTLRTSNAIQKIIYAAGELNEARFLTASWKWNAITSGVVFTVSSGLNFYKWCRGEIKFKEFMKLELVQAGGAIGSVFGGMGGSKIGFGIGALGLAAGILGPWGVILIAAGCGFLGAIGGQMGGEKIFEYLSDKIAWFEDDDLKKKADTFVESMIVLETPEIDQLDEHEVFRCFRRKALQCHPDRLPLNASKEDKEMAKMNWYIFEMARDLLLKYCENPAIISLQLKKKVKQLYRKYKEDVDMIQLKEHLESMKVNKISGDLVLRSR